MTKQTIFSLYFRWKRDGELNFFIGWFWILAVALLVLWALH